MATKAKTIIPAKAGTHAPAASRYDATTLADIERACAHLTQGHPIVKWRQNPDGTFAAFNDIGQKFIVIVTPLNDLLPMDDLLPPPKTKPTRNKSHR